MRAERVRADIQAPLAAIGLLVEEVTVSPAGRRTVVRIAVDHDLDSRPPADDTTVVPPLSLDEVAEATRVVSAALDDDADLGNQPYVLEVSSPGVNRRLTTPRHLRRNVGRLVVLTRTDASRVAGRIRAVSADAVQLVADPALPEGADALVPLAQVRHGTVVVEFGHPEDVDDGEDR